MDPQGEMGPQEPLLTPSCEVAGPSQEQLLCRLNTASASLWVQQSHHSRSEFHSTSLHPWVLFVLPLLGCSLRGDVGIPFKAQNSMVNNSSGLTSNEFLPLLLPSAK